MKDEKFPGDCLLFSTENGEFPNIRVFCGRCPPIGGESGVDIGYFRTIMCQMCGYIGSPMNVIMK